MALHAISNYPEGFGGGVSIRGVPVMAGYSGNIYWVSSVTGANSYKGTRDRPFATLGYAISRCTANQGDVIFIAPGHAESITSATALLFNVAGLTIIGTGGGATRPTFTFTTANTAKIPVSAANITIQNCVFVGNFLSIATCFLLTAAPEFWVDNCEFRDTSAILGFLSIITTTVSVNSDGLKFTDNRVTSNATTTPGPTLVIANTMSGLTVVGNYVNHTVASNNISALIEHGALVMTGALVAWNYVFSVNTDTATGALLVKTTATTGSGMIMHNRIRALDTAAAIIITAAAVQYGKFDNLYVGDAASSGFLLPAADTDA